MNVILITGCSSGFGMLFAARLAASGHTVYASMRNLKKKDDLLGEVSRRGGEIQLLQLDVTDDSTIETAIQQIEEDVGRLDVLINNAGYGIAGFFEDLTEEEIREQMETNFFGVQKVTRCALPLMRKTVANSQSNGSSKIINISSIQGISPIPGLGAYAASKFALEGFSESLYHELKPFGISVVLVEPGSYRTKIVRENGRIAKRAGNPESPYTPYVLEFQNRIRRILKTGKGMGNPEDVAKLIEKIVNKRNPRLRYIIGGQSQLRVFLRWILPDHWFSIFIRKSLFGKI